MAVKGAVGTVIVVPEYVKVSMVSIVKIPFPGKVPV
jgi:hypothetical protein